MRHPVYLIILACLAEILSMAGVSTFPALLPLFQEQWGLSHTEAGWINAIYFAGYLVAVLVLVSLTDRIDPRRIYLSCMLLSFCATAGFGLFAQGLWSALLLRGLAGVGLAGTYMPGLKMLSDLIPGPAQSRAVAFYTSNFGLGTSISYYFSGIGAERYGWELTFQLLAAGPLGALLLVMVLFPAVPQQHGATSRTVLSVANFRRVLANRGVMGYVLAYMMHNFELFGFRAWVVAFLVFLQRLHPAGFLPWSSTVLATLANMMSVPSSVLGNELATRRGRRQVASWIMVISGLTALGLGFASTLSGEVFVVVLCFYGWTITGESSTITAGVVAEAEDQLRGMTMAVHSCIGFLGSFLGPLTFGVILDLSGGGETLSDWVLAFGVMGLAAAAAPLMMLPLTRGGKTDLAYHPRG